MTDHHSGSAIIWYFVTVSINVYIYNDLHTYV